MGLSARSRIELGVMGVVLLALVGWLMGALIENPPGPGGLQFVGALIGAIIAVAILVLGEALKSK
jgi:uncharacterized membrane protein YeaQ/YmgE (transglycosylase-associated protein family)